MKRYTDFLEVSDRPLALALAPFCFPDSSLSLSLSLSLFLSAVLATIEAGLLLPGSHTGEETRGGPTGPSDLRGHAGGRHGESLPLSSFLSLSLSLTLSLFFSFLFFAEQEKADPEGGRGAP